MNCIKREELEANIVEEESASATISLGLHSLARHSVDDAISTGVHVPHNQRDDVHSKKEYDEQPKPHVENDGEITPVFRCQVHGINVHFFILKTSKSAG